MSDKQMKIFAFDFSGPGHLSAGMWRHPKDRGTEYKNVDYWVEYAKELEAAGFDGLFFADNNGYHDKYKGSVDESLRDVAQIPANDPAYLIPAMAAATTGLAFGCTSSTAYEHPYVIARKFSTLDHLTKGRVGWNIVTSYSDSAAKNHSAGEQLSHDDRYARAEEFADVCFKLWEGSWEDDAVVLDREHNTYVDPAKVHEIHHEGKNYSVPGIHLCEPSLQRSPVIFQAGGSSRGVQFAAETAEAVFMNSVSKPGLKKWVDNFRAKLVEAGREPDSAAVLEMITVVSAPTDEAAQAKYEEYLSFVSYDGAMARYSGWAGLDMSELEPDVPLEDVKTNAGQTQLNVFTKMDPDKKWTPRDIAEYVGIGGAGPVIVGGPETIADELQSWIDETGIDGFNIAHAVQYQDIHDFIEYVVPVLQERGLMRTEVFEGTLRENLFGKGNARLPENHPGAKYRANFSK